MHKETTLKAGESSSTQAGELGKDNSPRILVVDDAPDVVDLLTDILTEHGYTVIPASNGHAALRAVAAGMPDLILLDVKMPEMDGYEVCRHLKSDEQSCRIPVIFISGFHNAAGKIKGFNAGGVDYITKPFQLEEVLARIETHLALYRLQKQLEGQNVQLQQEITEREQVEEELRKHKTHLEKLVDERTAELRTINKELQEEIVERKQAEEALRESEELYRVLAEQSFAGVYVVQDGKICFFNPTATSYTGYTLDELIGKESMILVHPEDREQLKRDATAMLRGERTLPYEFRAVTREGKIIWFMETVTSIVWDGRPAVLGNCMDLTERKRMEEEIHSLSMTDPLTGLNNRRGFLTFSEQQLKFSDRHQREMLLFFSDLDGMKWINDTLGHEEGDKALIDVASILKETFRVSDIIARVGGDEFAILAIDATGISPEIIMARLQNRVDACNDEGNRRYKISISIGSSYYNPENPCSLDDLMSRADTLMYEQKRSKRNRDRSPH
jgi:diguanylate cyclase (GGDEF)-like protein/PAS domain S-box-containing protein